ncbi:helix-turn-helix domain-containing protein [Dactylosporangium darangshiense]
MRARIVLAAAAGSANPAIARELGIARSTAVRWRRRFAAEGLNGLLDKPRPARPQPGSGERPNTVGAEPRQTAPDAPDGSVPGPAGPPDPPPPPVSLVRRMLTWRPRRPASATAGRRPMLVRRLDVVVLVLGMLLSGINAVAGAAHVAWYWLFGLGGVIAGIGATASSAATATEAGAKIRGLWIALGLSGGLLLGIFGYHTYLDPASHQVTPVEMVVTLPAESYVVHPQGRPGGSDQFAFPPLIDGAHVRVDCVATAPDGTAWYRLAADHSFIPVAAVSTVKGLGSGRPAACS